MLPLYQVLCFSFLPLSAAALPTKFSKDRPGNQHAMYISSAGDLMRRELEHAGTGKVSKTIDPDGLGDAASTGNAELYKALMGISYAPAEKPVETETPANQETMQGEEGCVAHSIMEPQEGSDEEWCQELCLVEPPGGHPIAQLTGLTVASCEDKKAGYWKMGAEIALLEIWIPKTTLALHGNLKEQSAPSKSSGFDLLACNPHHRHLAHKSFEFCESFCLGGPGAKQTTPAGMAAFATKVGFTEGDCDAEDTDYVYVGGSANAFYVPI